MALLTDIIVRKAVTGYASMTRPDIPKYPRRTTYLSGSVWLRVFGR